ncbi:MAG: TlyA family RNA methyltransferase [Desulfovibrio sp.]|uniref:TlyA family RNA methyltransferase n=1 Tax=Desulfovibrio sp. 7SRBS1 TaxID=3378064 RepID=UPI003B424FE0
MAKKQRADHLVHAQGLAESREQAKRLIMAGKVFMARGELPVRVDKPGQQLTPDMLFEIRGVERFVSRGGYKLLTAIEHFELNVAGMVGLDAGASTGGFTDCLLQHGASRVYAVDVGHGQLHERMRTDARVINMERTNLRTAGPDLIPEKVDIVVADVSFISLTKIIPPCLQFHRPQGLVVAMVKPQFELEPHQIGKGVVRDEELQLLAVKKITDFCRDELGLICRGVVPSRIKGPKGNQEYLTLFESEPCA